MLQDDLASGRSATEASREADARREANRRRREEEAAAEVKNPVMVRRQPSTQRQAFTAAVRCVLMEQQHAQGFGFRVSKP